MASAWIVRRTTKNGGNRYRVEFRLGGRESASRYAGSFKRKTEAETRKRWVLGELAAMRVLDRTSIVEPPAAPLFPEAADIWRGSRIDVVESTGVVHRVAIARVFRVRPAWRNKRVDAFDHNDVIDLIGALVDKRIQAGVDTEDPDSGGDGLRSLRDHAKSGAPLEGQAAKRAADA